MKQAGSAAEYLAEIEARFDHPDLVADPAGHQRGLRVVEHDTFLAVEPALALVDASDNGGDAKRQDLVLEKPGLRVENLPLPGKMIDESGDFGGEARSGAYDCGPLTLSVGNVPRRAGGEEFVELRLRHSQQLLDFIRHGSRLLS